MPSTAKYTTEDQMVYLDLTCNRSKGQENEQEKMLCSTHDCAETMIYSFVDNSPHVADLLWSKQQLGQSEFLKLTPETEDEHHVIHPSSSTHTLLQ
ncbi:hypothetical protein G6F37_008258 [Rhizopus arrhizus]|nr:hypothetical protein G6F38_007825 [Rhizopus arrhizus]KAG1155748.1 hypothetical protein G6F37_008258 [Rhizopus arrhizus]